MKSRYSPDLRTIDVARRVGYSVAQVRKLERGGVLPAAIRTAAGYRVYDETHVRSARAYRNLAAGIGPVEAATIMRLVHTGRVSDVLARLDAAHTRLDIERRVLELAEAAARNIAEEAIGDVRRSDEMSISELAAALDVRSSTLRHWDAVGLVVPGRGTARDRRYAPRDVRDARIVHQLRLADYRIAQLRPLMPQLRNAQPRTDVLAGLAARGADIQARSRALLAGAAALDDVIPARASSR